MIEDIIKLREKGLSFRKIALELNTTVGKVQYRFNKWEALNNSKNEESQKEVEKYNNKTAASIEESLIQSGELKAKLVSNRKMFLFWEASELPQRVIERFFNQKFEDLVSIIRVYDVTDILFDGKNAHHFYEITVPYQNGHWFIKGLIENRSYVAELGVYLSGNEFFPLLRSNNLQTPSPTIMNGAETNKDLLFLQAYEEKPPRWIDHVSTYSYYGESKHLEEENE